MSTTGGSMTNSSVATAYKAFLISNYISVASASLVLYNTVITSGQDIELIWKQNWSAVTLLFAANRVFGVLFAASSILGIEIFPQQPRCLGFAIYYMAPQLLLFIVYALFSALRVYAIGGRAWRAATVAFIMALVPFVIQLYIDSISQFWENYIVGWICGDTPAISAKALNILGMVARGSSIASDVIVLFITWRQTYAIRKQAAMLRIKTSLATLLLRDGTAFFATILALNVVQIWTLWGATYTNAQYGLDISFLVTSASCIIMSRFFLSLRQLSQDKPNSGLSGIVLGTQPNAPGTVAIMGREVGLSSMLHSNGYVEEDEELPQGLETPGELTEPPITAEPALDEIAVGVNASVLHSLQP